MELSSGTENGKRWIAGLLPMRKNVVIEVDTRTGKGLDVVLEHMGDTIKWHAGKMKLPSLGHEDLVQELRLLVLVGVSEYDITKHTNLMTFLQQHLRNRIVNLYKFTTERCRTPIHERYRLYKVRCPDCGAYSLADEAAPGGLGKLQCRVCGRKNRPNETWRRYPLPMAMFSSDEAWMTSETSETLTLQDLVSYEDLAAINFSDGVGTAEALTNRLVLAELAQKSDLGNRLIIQHLLEGSTMQEMCDDTGFTTAEIREKVQNLTKAAE